MSEPRFVLAEKKKHYSACLTMCHGYVRAFHAMKVEFDQGPDLILLSWRARATYMLKFIGVKNYSTYLNSASSPPNTNIKGS
jgi:hypothetical protein